jgi:hypothetical protein
VVAENRFQYGCIRREAVDHRLVVPVEGEGGRDAIPHLQQQGDVVGGPDHGVFANLQGPPGVGLRLGELLLGGEGAGQIVEAVGDQGVLETVEGSPDVEGAGVESLGFRIALLLEDRGGEVVEGGGDVLMLGPQADLTND